MLRSRRALHFATLVVVSASVACSRSTPATAPATPAMPAHWKLVSDENFAPADIKPVAARLGAAVGALRNTTYDVDGKTVKLNTLVAANATDADAIMAALGRMKPEEFFIRRGLIIYEFVGPDDAMAEMRDARSLLTEN